MPLTPEQYEALRASAERFLNRTLLIHVPIDGENTLVEHEFTEISRGVSIKEKNQPPRYQGYGKLVSKTHGHVIAYLQDIIDHFEKEEK